MKLNSKHDFLKKITSNYSFSKDTTYCIKESKPRFICNTSDYHITSKHSEYKNLNSLDEYNNHIYRSKQQYINTINGNKCL